MLDRSIIGELKKWAASKNRKPLILRGARQVGKTTAVNIFSQNFDQYIYLTSIYKPSATSICNPALFRRT